MGRTLGVLGYRNGESVWLQAKIESVAIHAEFLVGDDIGIDQLLVGVLSLLHFTMHQTAMEYLL
jgi:hypothetical protein